MIRHCNIFALVATLAFVCACDLADLPIDVDPAEEKLVISSVVGPGPSLLVTVSRSFSALSATDVDSLETDFVERLLVDNAEVLLMHDSGIDTLFGLPDVPGVYGNLVDVESSDMLEISVFDSTTQTTVTATTELLAPVEILDASVAEEINSRDDTTTILTYHFEDLPGDNFYVLHAYKLPEDGSLDSAFVDGGEVSIDGIDEDLVFYQTLITDLSFDQSSIRDTVRIPFFSVHESVALSLSHISEGYYRFLDAQRRTGGVVSSLVSEPVTHPTNVVGGLGYFTAHQPTAIVIEKE